MNINTTEQVFAHWLSTVLMGDFIQALMSSGYAINQTAGGTSKPANAPAITAVKAIVIKTPLAATTRGCALVESTMKGHGLLIFNSRRKRPPFPAIRGAEATTSVRELANHGKKSAEIRIISTSRPAQL
jgi:hypothetical protein